MEPELKESDDIVATLHGEDGSEELPVSIYRYGEDTIGIVFEDFMMVFDAYHFGLALKRIGFGRLFDSLEDLE
jgi:hypothetical protein